MDGPCCRRLQILEPGFVVLKRMRKVHVTRVVAKKDVADVLEITHWFVVAANETSKRTCYLRKNGSLAAYG